MKKTTQIRPAMLPKHILSIFQPEVIFALQFYKKDAENSETLLNDKLKALLHALFYLAGIFHDDDLFKNIYFI